LPPLFAAAIRPPFFNEFASSLTQQIRSTGNNKRPKTAR